ncbi:hypothetical protein D3Z46_01165 [Bacteroides sartorii]|jgi:hypothetical protein|nr:hypothetical protein [Phocaeicola sartorii]
MRTILEKVVAAGLFCLKNRMLPPPLLKDLYVRGCVCEIARGGSSGSRKIKLREEAFVER